MPLGLRQAKSHVQCRRHSRMSSHHVFGYWRPVPKNICLPRHAALPAPGKVACRMPQAQSHVDSPRFWVLAASTQKHLPPSTCRFACARQSPMSMPQAKSHVECARFWELTPVPKNTCLPRHADLPAPGQVACRVPQAKNAMSWQYTSRHIQVSLERLSLIHI